MDSDSDDAVNLNYTEDESSYSSLKSLTEDEEEEVSTTLGVRGSTVMSGDTSAIPSLKETSSCEDSSTIDEEAGDIGEESSTTHGETSSAIGATVIGGEVTSSLTRRSHLYPCTPGLETTTGAETVVYTRVPTCSGSPPVHQVGGLVSTNIVQGNRKASGDQILEIVKKAKDSNYALSMETVNQEISGAKEVHINMTRTDIHQPTAVNIGSRNRVVCTEKRNQETQAPPTALQKLKSETERTYKDWTEGMVETKATRTILNKILMGSRFVTVTGAPGEGKTTNGYFVLKLLHDRGREVFDVKTPDDYKVMKESKQSVIMLNDIFGALSYDPGSINKWQNVLSDVLALSEHKGESHKAKKKRIPELTVILISRLSVLKEAGKRLGKYKNLILSGDNVVNLTEAESETSERMKIWKCHAERYNITIDSRLLRDVWNLKLSHGFPHCCKLFAAMYSEDNQLNIKKFFFKPLEFLNQSMESLLEDLLTGPLLREMLKNDGSLCLESVDNSERRYRYSSVAESLGGTYLFLNGFNIEFCHPSIYDSAAYVVCQIDPSFVISHCSLSFLNERVRLKGLTQNINSPYSPYSLIHSTYDKLLIKRFREEFDDRNILGVLSHPSFLDKGFVSSFMHYLLPLHSTLPMSKQVKELLSVCDKHSTKSFLFLMTKSGSDKILRYIHEHVKLTEEEQSKAVELTEEEQSKAVELTEEEQSKAVELTEEEQSKAVELTEEEQSKAVELTEEEQSEALFGVCEHSSVSSLEYLLERYKNINLEVTDCNNQTPLLLSSQKRSQDVIRILLERNVNVNITEKMRITLLLNVCHHGVDGDGSVVKLLVDEGADASVSMSPLYVACQAGNANIVANLLQFHVFVRELTCNQNLSCLLIACYFGHVDVVSLLLGKGADINTTDYFGKTPLHAACNGGSVDLVSLLLDKGADTNTVNSFGETPLHAACIGGSVDVVSLLLDKGADINTASSDGEKPLHAACIGESVDVVSLLLDKGADINTASSDGETPLHAACNIESVDVVSLLLDKGADINTASSDGETPLHAACNIESVDVVSLLLDKGADINTVNSRGETPLYAACYRGSVDIVSLLLDKGADINTARSDGETPLHRACNVGSVDLVSLLLDKGADINTKISRGETPLHAACFGEHFGVISLLLDKGADINTASSDGETPLHRACNVGSVDVVSLLLDKGADINTVNSDGETPLHAACFVGLIGVVSLLLDKGADINVKDRSCKTPLHIAFDRGHDDVVSLLLDKGATFNTENSDS